jgi:predicted transposase YbfD/YdcC
MRRSHDRFAAADRGHLGIENCLRWCLGVPFREDHSRVHASFAADTWHS